MLAQFNLPWKAGEGELTDKATSQEVQTTALLFDLTLLANPVKGGVKPDQWGGVKVGQ